MSSERRQFCNDLIQVATWFALAKKRVAPKKIFSECGATTTTPRGKPLLTASFGQANVESADKAAHS